MTSTMKDVFFWAGCTVASLLLLLVAIPLGVEIPPDFGDNSGISPKTWPTIISALLLCLSVLLTYMSYAEHKNIISGATLICTDGKDIKYDGRGLIVTIICLFLYYFSIDYLGIAISSVLFFIVFAVKSGERRALLMISIACLLVTALYYFFLLVARVPLPLGPLGGIV